MVEQVRALVALVEDLSSVPSIHLVTDYSLEFQFQRI